MAKKEISLGKDFGDLTVKVNGVSVDIDAAGRITTPAASAEGADPELKDRLLRMTAESPYGTLNGRKLFMIFKEAQAEDIARAMRELEQEKKIYVAGTPRGFEIFQCIFVNKQ